MNNMRVERLAAALGSNQTAVVRLLLLLAAIVVASIGLADDGYRGSITGGCSQAYSHFLKQSTSASPRAITFCDQQNADLADLVVGPITPGTRSVTVDIAGYGDTPGISAALIGADGHREAVVLPRAGDRWVRWTIDVPATLQAQESRLVVSDQTKEGFGWIGVGIAGGFGGWPPVSITLVLLAILYPWLSRLGGSVAPGTEREVRSRRRSVLTAICISVATLAAMMLRRPSQWSHPYVWVEDGKELLPHFLEYGWATFFHPVAGYILIPNKLINALAVTISFRWLPEISLGLAALVTVAVMVILAVAPTRLRGAWACALAVLAVPTDPEVFTTSAYVLWWAAFLVVIPLFWDERSAPSLRWRMPMLVIGAFSSPLIVMMAPLYGLRALLLRQRNEWWMLLAAGTSAAVQAALVLYNPIASEAHRTLPGIQPLLERFMGHFLYWHPENSQPALFAGLGAALALVIALAAWAQRRQGSDVLAGLVACFVLSVAAAAARVPIDPLDPFTAGPRYFFYPYVFLAWILIQLAFNARGPGRVLFVLLLLAPLHQTVLYGRLTHAPLDWRAEIRRCTSGQASEGPAVHWTGRMENLWYAPLSASQCRHLVEKSLFDNRLTPADLPPQPHTPDAHPTSTENSR